MRVIFKSLLTHKTVAFFAVHSRQRSCHAIRYKRHVIVVGGGRVGIAVALALSRAATAAVNKPKPEKFQVESLFTGPDSLNPAIRALEEKQQRAKAIEGRQIVPHDLKITMLVRDPEIATAMQRTRICAPYFPSVHLPDDVEVSADPQRSLMQFCPPSESPKPQDPQKSTLYAATETSNEMPRVPIEAIFMCVPFAALFTLFAPHGLLHCLTKPLPWQKVFAPSPAMVLFTKGIDEEMTLPCDIIAKTFGSEAKWGAKGIPFVCTQVSGPFQPIELIDGKPVSALATSGPCATAAEHKLCILHETRVAHLLDCRAPQHLLFIHRFHTQNACIHAAHTPKERSPCLRATTILAALKEFYCLLYGLLRTTWSAQNGSAAASAAIGSCTSAGAALQVAFVNECARLLDALSLPSGAAYTIGGAGDIAAGCGTSGGGSKALPETAQRSLGQTTWQRLEAACRRHLCDLHPLYLMGIRIAQGLPGSYIFQLKARPQEESTAASKFDGKAFQHTSTPNMYAQYVLEGVERLVETAEANVEMEGSPFPVTRACIKALKNDRRPRELANIVLRPAREDVAYSPIDMENIDNRDPDVYRHPIVDVFHVLSDSVVRPTNTAIENEEKLRLRMPAAPPAMKSLFS